MDVGKKILIYLFAILVIGAVFFFVGRCSGPDSTREINGLKNQVDGLGKTYRELESIYSRIRIAANRATELQSEVIRLTQRITIISRRLSDTNKKLESANSDSIDLVDEIIRILSD